MNNQTETIRNNPKTRKGIVQRVIIRAGRIGYAAVASVWAFFVAFVRIFARLLIGFIVAFRFEEPSHHRYNEFGQSLDITGRPRLDPYD